MTAAMRSSERLVRDAREIVLRDSSAPPRPRTYRLAALRVGPLKFDSKAYLHTVILLVRPDKSTTTRVTPNTRARTESQIRNMQTVVPRAQTE